MLRRLLAWLGAFALMVAPAAAQDLHPRVDPNSPAGTEYQLPTDRAREQAGGGGGSRGSSSAPSHGTREAPLFGAGVQEKTPPARKKPSARGGAASSGSHEPATTTTTSAATTTRSEQPDLGTATPEVHALARAPDDGGAGMLAIGAVAAGVLLVGALAGLLWRRRASP